MAVKMPERKYFTFPELIRRWECDENDIRRMILDRELIPSYVINDFVSVVKFKFNYPDIPDYESGYWTPDLVERNKLPGELEEDDSPKYLLVDADGFYYLLHPWQKTSLNCTFVYFSGNKGHQQDSGETCFMLRQKILSLDDVMKNGVAMADEVLRLERRDTYLLDTANVGETEIRTRERNTLLTIIAALCREAKMDFAKPAKTAALIRGIMDGMGVDVGESTIEGHLKKIPEALERRTK